MVLCKRSLCITIGTLLGCFQPQTLASPETVVIATRIGLTPEALSIAELHSETAILLQRIDDATELRTIAEAHMQHVVEQEALLLLCSAQQSQMADDEQVSQLCVTAQDELSSAKQQLEETLALLRSHVLDGVSPSQREVVDRVRIAARYKVPSEFYALECTELQWCAIETALRAESRAMRTGEELEDEFNTLLQQTRSKTQVISAHQNLTLHLEQVRQVFASVEASH